GASQIPVMRSGALFESTSFCGIKVHKKGGEPKLSAFCFLAFADETVWLKVNLCCELCLTSVCGRRDLAEGGRESFISPRAGRVVELCVIENVIAFHTELEFAITVGR